ncbi:MAG TPA: MOSC domain-containing protein [Candidatus Saccharimonadales bacterium]|jgi:MOSC domain-containing protein YiiM|nr:MOSC domain-containing protein [Candidatus Saccharimonadales bacterium]
MTNHFALPPAVLESVQIGAVRNYGRDDAVDTHDLPWTTGFFKSPVSGPIKVSATNLDGDAQADLINHGGVDKAVLAYSADHYPKWREELHIPDLPFGAFGENLTIAGLSEESVCIGDIFRVGSVKFEVSQPRQPCWKLARRWRMHELTGLVIRNGRSGWYFRVLEEGNIAPHIPVTLIERPNPKWSIARANRILHHQRTDLAATLELAAVPKLADSWVEELQERAQRLRTLSLQ